MGEEGVEMTIFERIKHLKIKEAFKKPLQLIRKQLTICLNINQNMSITMFNMV